MPWKLTWVPSDEKIEVLDNLNEEKFGIVDFTDYKVAFSKVRNGPQYYFCPQCNLWIMGEPEEFDEDTLRGISGRDGVVVNCKKCGYELAFRGWTA